MVKEVTAWRAEDGSLCESEEEALKIEVKRQLRTLGIFQQPTIDVIVENAQDIIDKLTALLVFYETRYHTAEVAPLQSETVTDA